MPPITFFLIYICIPRVKTPISYDFMINKDICISINYNNKETLYHIKNREGREP